jgi:hypothetical protein
MPLGGSVLDFGQTGSAGVIPEVPLRGRLDFLASGEKLVVDNSKKDLILNVVVRM